jgi:hypothetical protein
MSYTLVGYFPELDGATRARAALLQAGFAVEHIGVRSSEQMQDPARTHPAIVDNRSGDFSDRPDTGPLGWLRDLFGNDDPDDHAGRCARALERGGYLLTLDAIPDRMASEAVEIMEQHGAVELDEHDPSKRPTPGEDRAWGGDMGLPGVAGRPPAAGPEGLRTDVDRDFGHKGPEDDDRYQLDERGYPPLHDADPADVARLLARRGRVRVVYRA